MIVKGGSRARASSLAVHLLRTDTNENITLLEAVIPGDDTAAAVHKSLTHFEYMTKLTNGTKGLYHANIDPDGRYDMSEEEWTRAIDILEERLNLHAQPRLVVMHEKKGRQHVHVVWQRTDAEKCILISDSMNYPKHELAARQMEREFGHVMVKGVFTGRERDEERPIAKTNHTEWQQGERTKVNPEDRKAEIAALWQRSDSGQAFVSALHEAGYELARGDKKPIHMLVKDGEFYELRRSLKAVLTDIKKEDIETRLADYPAHHLPLAAEVKARQTERRQEIPMPTGSDEEARKREASRAAQDAFKRAAVRTKQLDKVEEYKQTAADMVKAPEGAAGQKEQQQQEAPADEQEQDAPAPRPDRVIRTKRGMHVIPDGDEGTPIEEAWPNSRVPKSLKGAKIYQTQGGPVIVKPEQQPGRQQEPGAQTNISPEEMARQMAWRDEKRATAAEIREQQQGKFEEQSNEKRAEMQSWQMDERIQMERRHGRAMKILMGQLNKYYGPEIEKNKEIIAGVEQRQQQGGLWYRLFHARKDQGRADVARLNLQSGEDRVEMYRGKLAKEQKSEETQLNDRQRHQWDRMEGQIDRDFERMARNEWQPTPEQSHGHDSPERTATEQGHHPEHSHRPEPGPTYNHDSQGFGP